MSLEAMGLPEDADEAAVRARFKELAMEAHPDKGGSAERFQQVSEWRDHALKQVKMGETLASARSALFKLREAARGTKCARCDGTGVKMERQIGFRTFKVPCTLCRGTGVIQ